MMLHKIRFETKDGFTRVFLDDQEVHGCIKANFDYDIECLPVVQLTLNATEIKVEADSAKVYRAGRKRVPDQGISDSGELYHRTGDY